LVHHFPESNIPAPPAGWAKKREITDSKTFPGLVKTKITLGLQTSFLSKIKDQWQKKLQ
jgi:hypothetical protein